MCVFQYNAPPRIAQVVFRHFSEKNPADCSKIPRHKAGGAAYDFPCFGDRSIVTAVTAMITSRITLSVFASSVTVNAVPISAPNVPKLTAARDIFP